MSRFIKTCPENRKIRLHAQESHMTSIRFFQDEILENFKPLHKIFFKSNCPKLPFRQSLSSFQGK